MVAIAPHTTRATGTILTANMYNGDHAVHISNAQALNLGKTEKSGAVIDGHLAVWDGVAGNLRDGGTAANPPWVTANYADDSVTFAKTQNIATSRILGRVTASSGDIEELTSTQATTLINTFTSALKGLVPASGGGTTNFLRADGSFTAPPQGLQLLTSGTVTGAATLDIVLTSYTAYKGFFVELYGFLPVTDNVDLFLRFSTNGGTSYDATGYSYSLFREFGSGGTNFGSNPANQLSICGGNDIGNVSNEGIHAHFQLMNLTSTAFWSRALWHAIYQGQDVNQTSVMIIGGGARRAAQDTDAIRFLFSSGNISTGGYALYGLS